MPRSLNPSVNYPFGIVLTLKLQFHFVLSTEDTFSVAGDFFHIGLLKSVIQAVEGLLLFDEDETEYIVACPIYDNMVYFLNGVSDMIFGIDTISIIL